MPSRIDRANRTLLSLLGLLLLLLGAAGLALSFGAFGSSAAGKPVLPSELSTFIADNPWFWWAVAVVAVVVALLMLRWLIGQLQTSRLNGLDVEPDHSRGETVLRAGAIADGVEHEVDAIPGVRDVSMRLRGTPVNHRHRLRVALDDRADLDLVRTCLTEQTVPHIRSALDFEEPALDIELVLAARQRRRVG